LAGTGTAMERDDDYATAVFHANLPNAAVIGQKAAERAVKKLGGRKMPTAQVPIVFEPRIANTLLSCLAGAISGSSVARGTSFLKDKMGQNIFANGITIIDDPFRARGLRSKAFDAEGLPTQKRKIVDSGRLTTWFLDLHSARQLGMTSTGHASRGTSSPPSPSPHNLYIEPGLMTPDELIKDIKQGFYVTDLMGSGINGVTGDFSQAASGFWIENGVIAFPVTEMTIAGNLKDMFLHVTAANDLEFRYGLDSPTLRIEGMMVAGV
jgi:PmbA protein